MARIPLQIASRGLDTGSPVQYPGDSPVGRAVEGFGNQLGAATDRIRAEDERAEALSRQFLGNAAERARVVEERRIAQLKDIEAFETNQRWVQNGLAVQAELPEIQSQTPASGLGLHDALVGTFEKRTNDFLATVPPELQPKYRALAETAKLEWSNKAALAELEQRNNWYRTGIASSLEIWQNSVFENPEGFDAAIDEFNREVDASGLPPDEKDKLKQEARQVFIKTLSAREIREAEARAVSAPETAARLGVTEQRQGGEHVASSAIREFEGYRDTPYWDVNAYRIGYGSDTITDANGNVRRVRPGDKISRADAERDLQRRALEFERTAIGQVGVDAWSRLPAGARAALTSVAYNYGSLPRSVVGAVKGGNINAIAGAVGSLSANPGRRAKEAAIIRGETQISSSGGGDIGSSTNGPAAPGVELDPRYAELLLSDRLEIYDSMIAASIAGQKQRDAQAKAEYTAYYERMNLSAATGEIKSEQTILSDPTLNDGDKLTVLRTWRSMQDEASKTDLAVQDYIDGNLTGLNPLDSDDRKLANDTHKALSARIEGQPEEVVQAENDRFIQQTSIIPNSIQADIRRGVYSTDPQQFAEAMDEAGRIQDMAPISFDSMSDGDKVRDDLIDFRHLVNVRGMGAREAAEVVLERRTTDWATKEKAYGPEAEKLAKEIEASEVTSHFETRMPFDEPGEGVDPSTRAHLLVEYREAFKDRFIERGDEGVARALALKDMEATWGITTMSGDTHLMKYPPEKAYPALDGSHEYLREDAIATVREFAGIAEDDAAEDVQVWLQPWVEPNGRVLTAEDWRNGTAPRYRILYSREVDGQQIIEQVPGTWAMPPEILRGKQEEARQAAMEAARAERAEQEERLRRVETFPARAGEAIQGELGRANTAVQRMRERVFKAMPGEEPTPDEQRAIIGKRLFGIEPSPKPGSKEAINQRLQRRGQELRDNADR